jgi:hypothetical protein
MSQEVWFMNSKRYRQKVATGAISGFGGQYKFHFTPIPKTWFKVDVQIVLVCDVAFMFSDEDVEQIKVKDVVGPSAI